MDDLITRVSAGGDFGKALFLMAAGLVFVFAVQTFFYILIKAFTRKKAETAV